MRPIDADVAFTHALLMRSSTLSSARAELGRRLEHWLELPMAILAAVWLALFVVELLSGVTPLTESLGVAIWVSFVVEFAARFFLAPVKRRFLRRNWITAISLLLPAVRVVRFARIIRLLRLGRTVRGLRLARLLTSFNRGMRALGSTMQSRGFPYVVALTAIVLLLGAAGMFAFEHEAGREQGFTTFSGSLWWTAMLLTTMGSEFWPQSPEGRLICLVLSVYAFAVFGYITATLASYFIGSDAERDRSRADRLEQELAIIRQAVQQLAEQASRQG
jgi:voltage-gated potassium channel